MSLEEVIRQLGGEESKETPGVFRFDSCAACTAALDHLQFWFPTVKFWASFDLLGVKES